MRRLRLLARSRCRRSRGCGDDTATTASRAHGWSCPPPSSLTDALTDVRAALRRARDVELSFAGSDELAAQIRQGGKPDVFAAANTKLPDELHAEGLLGSRSCSPPTSS